MEQEGGASQLLGTLRGGAGCGSNPGDNANGPCVLRAAQVLDTNPLRVMLLDSIHFVLPSVQMRKQPQRPAVTSQDSFGLDSDRPGSESLLLTGWLTWDSSLSASVSPFVKQENSSLKNLKDMRIK